MTETDRTLLVNTLDWTWPADQLEIDEDKVNVSTTVSQLLTRPRGFASSPLSGYPIL